MIIRGIDTLEFGILINNYDYMFKNLIEILEDKKIEAQQKMCNQSILINKVNFTVFQKGQGVYKYKIECNDFYMCFLSKEIKNTPQIYVRFYSNYLWAYEYKEAFNKFKEWFSAFDLDSYNVKISRIDICLDTDEFEFKSSDSEKMCTRAIKLERVYIDSENYSNKTFSGFVIGKGGKLSCRIYNKTLEIKKSNKAWFEDIWKQNGWNGITTVWRTEFQIRGKVIKELRICTVEELEKKLDQVWNYLTAQWLTIRVKSKDSNMSRWKVDKRWKKVEKANIEYEVSPVTREKIIKGSLDSLCAQCGGTLLSIAGLSDSNNLGEAFLKVVDYYNEKNKRNNTTIKQEIEKRKHRYLNS